MKTYVTSFKDFTKTLYEKAYSNDDNSTESNLVIMSIPGCTATKIGDELVVEVDEDKMFESIDYKEKCCEWLSDDVKDKMTSGFSNFGLLLRTLSAASNSGLLFLSPEYLALYDNLTKISTKISDPLLIGLYFLAGKIGYSDEKPFSDCITAAYLYEHSDALKLWLKNSGFGKVGNLDSNFFNKLAAAVVDTKIDINLLINYEVNLHYLAFFSATAYRRKFFGKLNKYLYTKYVIQRKEIERIADIIYNKL